MNYIMRRIYQINSGLIFLFALFFTSCSFDKEELVGKYLCNDNTNVFDTLVLNQNGTYSQLIYAPNGSLLYANKGKWKLSSNRITFQGFILDKPNSVSFSAWQDVTMTASFPIKRKENKPFIIVNSDLGKYYHLIE